MTNLSTEKCLPANGPDCACGMVGEGYPGPCQNYRGDDKGFCLTCDHAEECHDNP